MTRRDLVNRLFNQMLSIPEKEWNAFLLDSCQDDPPLRSMVLDMLSDSAKTGNSFDPSSLLNEGSDAPEPTAENVDVSSLEVPHQRFFAQAAQDRGPRVGGPRTVGHFEIIEEIGRGGMGVVYKAKDLSLDRVVALKSLPPALSNNRRATRQLLQEARTASVLDHPNICTVHEVLQTDAGEVFIAMCFYEGQTLWSKLRSGPLRSADAVKIALEVAVGLDKAHGQGVIHRDIKPGNIMLTRDGTAKILDFGLATLSTMNSTNHAGLMGTLAYMSPEQLAGSTVNQQTDIWSWGVVFFEMLTGALPYPPPDLSRKRIDRSGPLALRPLQDKAVSRGVAEVLIRSLQIDPATRYQQIADAILDLRHATPSATSSDVLSQRKLPSVAVLKFRNLTPESGDEYFSPGLQEELTDALARLDALDVAPRSSVATLPQSMHHSEVAAKLGVGFLLEGSVRRSSNKLRINVQLVDALNSRILWSEKFDREATDIFSIQEEIAGNVATNLKVRFERNSSEQLVKRYTHNLRAYNLYLKARYQWNRESPEALFSAVATLREATEADPEYVSPFCGLAECYLVMGARALLAPRDAWQKAKDASNRALELDPGLGDAHGCLGAVLAISEFNWTAAEQEFQHALQLSRDSALSRHWYAIAVLAPQGRLSEAVQQTSLAVEAEPLSLIYNSTLAWVHYLSRDWDAAIKQCLRTLEIDPHHFDSMWCLAASYGEIDRFQEAIHILRKLNELTGGIPLVFGSMGHSYARRGAHDEAQQMLSGLLECSHRMYASPICECWIHANLPGHQEQALDCLERSFADRDFMIRYIQRSPALDRIRDHPRFEKIVRQMGLPIQHDVFEGQLGFSADRLSPVTGTSQ